MYIFPICSEYLWLYHHQLCAEQAYYQRRLNSIRAGLTEGRPSIGKGLKDLWPARQMVHHGKGYP